MITEKFKAELAALELQRIKSRNIVVMAFAFPCAAFLSHFSPAAMAALSRAGLPPEYVTLVAGFFSLFLGIGILWINRKYLARYLGTFKRQILMPYLADEMKGEAPLVSLNESDLKNQLSALNAETESLEILCTLSIDKSPRDLSGWIAFYERAIPSSQAYGSPTFQSQVHIFLPQRKIWGHDRIWKRRELNLSFVSIFIALLIIFVPAYFFLKNFIPTEFKNEFLSLFWTGLPLAIGSTLAPLTVFMWREMRKNDLSKSGDPDMAVVRRIQAEAGKFHKGLSLECISQDPNGIAILYEFNPLGNTRANLNLFVRGFTYRPPLWKPLTEEGSFAPLYELTKKIRNFRRIVDTL